MSKTPLTATLIDIITDGFEGFQGCMECTNGWRERLLPMPSEESGRIKFVDLVAEASRWKGDPQTLTFAQVSQAKWPDLQIRWSGRGILVLVPEPRFGLWWHANGTWDDDPLGAVQESFWDEDPQIP